MNGSEREWVRWLGQRCGAPQWPVLLGIGDDMAAVEVGGQRLEGGAAVLVTSDMLLDGVHFDTAVHSFEQIGRKALACSLSDCAAMAVRPVAATVSVAWPVGGDADGMKRLFEGLWQLADEYGCAIVGGDTTSWRSPLALDVTVLAAPYAEHRPVRRSGARVGDTLYVTGPLGGSRLGRHLTFTPRIGEAHSLAVHLSPHLHAMMDLSDGLSLDLHRMCEASGVGAELVEALLKRVISDDARRVADADGSDPLDHALSDGEDFELLLAVGGEAPEPPSIEDVFLQPIGQVTAGGVSIKRGDSTVASLAAQGYEHRL